MQIIMEYFGRALLAILAVLGILAIVFSFMEPGGVLHNVILNYMNSICG